LSLNWREIDLILEELPLSGSYIQKLKQPDFESLIFDLYNKSERFSLYVNLSSGKTRIHRLTRNIGSAIKLQRFAQFLRSHIMGGKILSAYQLGRERIVKITVTKGGEATHLWIRLWGGASNVIATDREDTILDAFYRRPKRGEISGGKYNPETDMESLSISGKSKKEYSVRSIPGEGSFNQKIEQYYFEKEEKEKTTRQRDKLLQIFNQRESRLLSALEKLEYQYKNYENFEQYKQFADIIQSNLHNIKKGDPWLTAENFYNDNETVCIQLDPALTPAQNAEKYYKQYHKSKSGLLRLKGELEWHNRELAKLVSQKEKLLAENDHRRISAFLESESPGQAKAHLEKLPGIRFQSGDFIILVGRTAKESDELLRRFVNGNDIWMHVRDYPGGYVFIKNKPGKSIPLENLLDAGNLALYYSKGKNSGKGDLFYTKVKNLRRAKHGKYGMVIPTQEKNLTIKLDLKRIERLRNSREQVK